MKQESIDSSVKSLRQFIAVTALILGCTLTLYAQQSSSGPQVEIKGIVGGVGFLGNDDSLVGHSMVGAAVRIYVTKRVGIEPEFVYMYHDANDHDQSFNLNVSYDFRDRKAKYVPYLIGGGGWSTNHVRYDGFDFITNRSTVIDHYGRYWSASFGGGIKIFLTKRLFIAPEVRLGHEPVLRGSVSIGYVFGRKK